MSIGKNINRPSPTILNFVSTALSILESRKGHSTDPIQNKRFKTKPKFFNTGHNGRGSKD